MIKNINLNSPEWCELIFTNLFDENMSFTMRMVFGILFFCYTLFRGYRIIKDYKKQTS